MKDFIKYITEEQAVLSRMIGTGKVNEDYALFKLNEIEKTLELINEYESSRNESA
ncbi:MAG: hypothetical protein GY828_02790 [Candidatus Gracilibacteria bacterium]|nr:hypothetical protein [Candidatus Gracilibacteria bacterium]